MSDHPHLFKPATLDHLKKKKPSRKSIPVVIDEDARIAFEEAQSRFLKLTSQDAPEEELAAARTELEAADAALQDATVLMTFQSLGRRDYEKLIEDHPSTIEQKAEAAAKKEEEPLYDIETFPVALISACCIQPELTLDEAQEIFDEWNSSEVMTLFVTALEVCSRSRVGELGKGFGGMTG